MKKAGITGSYNRFYSALNFERAGLFKLINDEEALIRRKGKKYHIENISA